MGAPPSPRRACAQPRRPQRASPPSSRSSRTQTRQGAQQVSDPRSALGQGEAQASPASHPWGRWPHSVLRRHGRGGGQIQSHGSETFDRGPGSLPTASRRDDRSAGKSAPLCRTRRVLATPLLSARTADQPPWTVGRPTAANIIHVASSRPPVAQVAKHLSTAANSSCPSIGLRNSTEATASAAARCAISWRPVTRNTGRPGRVA